MAVPHLFLSLSLFQAGVTAENGSHRAVVIRRLGGRQSFTEASEMGLRHPVVVQTWLRFQRLRLQSQPRGRSIPLLQMGRRLIAF